MNFRRIVHRGLLNCSGELWYREGLPSAVFRRLVIRKESETPLDRFSGDYEELMTYATFRDLADIIVGNELLSERLQVLDPPDGVSLHDRLLELDEMRRLSSSSKKANGGEADKLERYHQEFLDALKGGAKTRRVGGSAGRGGRLSPRREPTVDVEDETLDSLFGSEDPPVPPPKKGRGRVVVRVSSKDLRAMAGDASPTPVADVSEAPVAFETGASSRKKPDEPPKIKPGDEAGALNRALENGDDSAVMRALHLEVTAIADGMLRHDPKTDSRVWEIAGASPWFEAKKTELGLEPLERFHALVDDYLEAFTAGAKASKLKEILSKAGFSKLLLAMREMFLDSYDRG